MKPAATYDLETENWTTYVLGALHLRDGTTEVFRHDRERELADALLQIDGEVYAHNGGRFDHLWLLDQHPDREAEVMTNASGIFSLRFKDSPALFVDSMRIFPFSLDTLTGGAKKKSLLAQLCPGHGKNHTPCGGYCQIKRNMPARVRRIVEEYAVADVVELMRALDHFAALADSWGVIIGRTLGSTAWKSAEEALGLEDRKWKRDLWEEVRGAYHGGRAEVFRRWSKAGEVQDVNSMYPWALTQPVPVGDPKVLEGRSALRAWVNGAAGVFRATVHVPADTWIPPLPISTASGVAFPTGTVRGHWPRPELEHALESGARVERIHSAVTWKREAAIFKPWVEKMYALRMDYGKSTREGKWLKWIVNALTGKLGTRAESRRIKINPDLATLAICRCELDYACACGGYRPVDETGRIWEQIVERDTVEGCAHPEWSSYLTGRARVRLRRKLIEPGDDSAVYCDTDSSWGEGSRPSFTGDELGEWQPQGAYRDFEALGPKAYHAWVAKEETTRLKGIPKPGPWEEVKQGIPQHFTSLAGIRRSRSGEKFFRVLPQERIARPTPGNREVRDENDPRTFPVDASTLDIRPS